MDFDIQLIERDPVFEISIKPVCLLHQDNPDAGMLAQIFDHFGEVGPAGGLGRLNVHKLLRNIEPLLLGIIAQQLALSRDGETFLVLLLGRYAGVE
ncbi:hypothetical protein NKH55_27135 [Mesorhizobium opportunistum]